MRKLLAVCLFGVVPVIFSGAAHAARYCVSTPLALAIALSQAQSNGENDDIVLEVGD